jgi:hypothetical protein
MRFARNATNALQATCELPIRDGIFADESIWRAAITTGARNLSPGRTIANEDFMNEKMSDYASMLLKASNNPLPQIAIPARKKLKAAIEAGEIVFVDAKQFGYAEEIK